MIQGEQAAFAYAISANPLAVPRFGRAVSGAEKKMQILTCPGRLL
jgi:hypothetical protein